MTVQEHLLACLIEECSEVIHRACKAQRFGIDDRDPTIPDAPSERVMIWQELNDLYAIIEMLKEEGILPLGFGDWRAIKAKKEKVRKFMDYARERGVLE